MLPQTKTLQTGLPQAETSQTDLPVTDITNGTTLDWLTDKPQEIYWPVQQEDSIYRSGFHNIISTIVTNTDVAGHMNQISLLRGLHIVWVVTQQVENKHSGNKNMQILYPSADS